MLSLGVSFHTRLEPAIYRALSYGLGKTKARVFFLLGSQGENVQSLSQSIENALKFARHELGTLVNSQSWKS